MPLQLQLSIFLFIVLTISSLISTHAADSHSPLINGFPIVRKLSEEFQDSDTIPGISHITVAGAVLHGFKEIEVWLETAAPGGRTPVHRHGCEEVFVVLKGTGTLYLASNSDDGSLYPGTPQEIPFSTNSTFHVAPNAVHQVVNTDGHENLQLLVVISRPPMKVVIYEDWTTPHEASISMQPFIWDVRYYNTPLSSPATEEL